MAVTTSEFVALSGAMVIFRSPVAVGTTPEVGPVGGGGGGGGSGDGWWTSPRSRLLTDGPHQLLGLGCEDLGEIFGKGIFQEIDVNLRAPGRQTHIQFRDQVEGHRHLVAPCHDDERVATWIGDDTEHLLGSR